MYKIDIMKVKLLSETIKKMNDKVIRNKKTKFKAYQIYNYYKNNNYKFFIMTQYKK